MPDAAVQLFEFFFKYPPRIFEQGKLVWHTAGSLPVVMPALVAAGAMAAMTYRNVRERSRPVDRLILGLLRCMVFGLLALCLLRPALLVSTSVRTRNALAVVFDDSRSMRIRDVDSLSRLAGARHAFADSGRGLLRALGDRFAIRTFRFAEGLDPLANPSHLTGSGTRTDLAHALAEVRQELAGTPVAGIVLVTDGADTGESPLAETLLALQGDKIPVYTVGVGEERFRRDLALDRIELPPSVLKGATMVGTVLVRGRGLGGQAVTLVVEDGGKIVATKEVTMSKTAETMTVPIRIPPLETGSRHIRVTARPVAGEAIAENNTVDAVVRVRDQREKVLYVEGEARFEFPFLRRAVAGDSNLQVVGLIRTSAGKFLRLGVDDSLELVRGFPTTRRELYRYRALVLGSIEASAFTVDQLRMIADFVGERGGGLVALGGRQALAEGGFAGTPVAEVLPAELVRPLGADSSPAVELAIRPTPAGAGHAALLLTGDEAGNRRLWDSMPALTSVNVIGALKPGATGLLEGRPSRGGGTVAALSFQRFGRGKVLLFPVQDSWLWRMHASVPEQDTRYQTFWRQTLRWMLDGVPERLDVATTPEHPGPGQRVTIRAELSDSSFLRVNDGAVVARVTNPAGAVTTVALDWMLGKDGVYQGSFATGNPGSYRVEVTAARGRDSLGADAHDVVVSDQGADVADAEMRAPLLRRIARETGGAFYTMATVDRLARDVEVTASGVTTTEAKDLWDMPIVFLAIVLLLTTEWGYRRWRGLA